MSGSTFAMSCHEPSDQPSIICRSTSPDAASAGRLGSRRSNAALRSWSIEWFCLTAWTSPRSKLVDSHGGLSWAIQTAIDTWLTGGSDLGNYVEWTIGTLLMRYVRASLLMTFDFKAANPSNPGNVCYLSDFTLTVAVPEPSTWAMMILGFAGIGFLAYRRRTNQFVAV